MQDPQRCASQLVNEAIAAGGHDNVTVIVADVTGYAEVRRKKLARKTKLSIALVLVLFAAIVAGAAWGTQTYLNTAAYLANDNGKVAVYRGVPGSVLGLSFSHLERTTDVTVADLQPGVANRLNEGIRVDDMEAADALVKEYEDEIAARSKNQAEGGNAESGRNADAKDASDARTAVPRDAPQRRTRPAAGGAPVVALLFAMIAINQGQSLDMTTLGVPAAIFVAFVIAHLAVRKFAANADPALLPLSFALSGIGIAFVTSLAPNLAVGQVMWLFVGVACMVLVLVFVRNLDKVANYKYTLMIVGFLLLLSPLVPGLGQEIYGSRIWLHIGSYSFQPGEIAKIVIVLFLAGYLAQNREMLSVFTWRVGPFRLPDIRTLLPLLLMWGIALVIVVFEKDLGSALVFFFVFLVMLYVATGRSSTWSSVWVSSPSAASARSWPSATCRCA